MDKRVLRARLHEECEKSEDEWTTERAIGVNLWWHFVIFISFYFKF